MTSKLKQAGATIAVCNQLETKMFQQHQALQHLELRSSQQNTTKLEKALEERDQHIARLEAMLKGRDADLLQMDTEHAQGKPVKMAPAEAEKMGRALLATLQVDVGIKRAKTNTKLTMDATVESTKEEEDFKAMPGWSLTTWLSGLQLQDLVSKSIQNHVANKAGRTLDSAIEQRFMQQLGNVGSRNTVMAMLRETTLVEDLADVLWKGVTVLCEDAEEEKRLAAERLLERASRPPPAMVVDDDDDDEPLTPEQMEQVDSSRREELASELNSNFEKDLQIKEERREQRKKKRLAERALLAKAAKEEAEKLLTQLGELETKADNTRRELTLAEEQDEPSLEVVQNLKDQLESVERAASEVKEATVHHEEKVKKRVEVQVVEEATIAKAEDMERAKDLSLKPRGWRLIRLDMRSRRSMAAKKPNKSIMKSDGRAYNEALKLDGNIMELSYAPSKVYFQGLATIVGRCQAEPGDDKTLLSLMYKEHADMVDSDARFEPPNFLIPTTSRIEYWAVADPINGLRELGLDDWPKEQRGAENGGRQLLPPSAFQTAWDEMNEKLRETGEPKLLEGGFVALRLYTGPMFFKYNSVLRGADVEGGIPYFQGLVKKLCMGNKYTNTMHAISASIGKLSRVTKCDLVYRAPGGILPKYFWEDDQFSVRGGIEMGFMSTSRSKHAAMEYAKFSGVKLIFEFKQGMVSRGADVSWLSMYPKEDEVLFPPMCACEVLQTRVEGSVVIVELRPGVAPCALSELSLEEKKEEERERAAKLRLEAESRRTAIDAASRSRARWMASRSQLKVSAENSMRKAMMSAAAKKQQQAASAIEQSELLQKEKDCLQEELKARKEFENAIREEARCAAEERCRALEAKELLHNAQHLAECMKRAALKQKLAEEQITLKKLMDAQRGDDKIMGKFKIALASSKLEGADAKVAAKQLEVDETLEKCAQLQKRYDEAHVRTLAAEDKVGKLTKELQGTKKMLDALMK